ncbi:Cysteine-rich receptor-like protein kinase [Arachis hypogaea]|nr:Cysteine-rich receptor-like protein kinase [Arachis hypogaea]
MPAVVPLLELEERKGYRPPSGDEGSAPSPSRAQQPRPAQKISSEIDLQFQINPWNNNHEDLSFFKDIEFQYFYDEHSITIDIEGSYTTNSTYHTNLNTLTSNILNNKEIDYGFYNVSYGEYPNRVYTIGLYRGDIKQEQCRTCLNQSKANLTAVCPNRKVAIGWYNDELCMLRYLNRRIFDWMDNGPAYYKKSDKNAMDLNEFNTKLNDLLNGLKSKASSGDSRLKYACTPDLSREDCDNCIAQSIERISKDCCKDSMRGKVIRPSSYTPHSPPASSPPTTTSVTNPSSGGKSHTSVLVIAITVPIVAVIMFMFIFIRSRYLRKRKQRKSNSKDDNTEDMKIVESLQFNLECIRDATNDFSDANKLGQGGFGVVYKGILTNGQEIAVKRLARSSGQ